MKKILFYNLKLTGILFLVISVFSGCVTVNYLRQPRSEQDKPGAAMFCATTNDNGILGWEDQPMMIFAKKEGDSFVPLKMPNDVKKIGGKEEQFIFPFNGSQCYIISALPPGDYALVYARYVWTEGYQVRYEYDANLFFDPNESYQAMPIKVRPGRITFAGIGNIIIGKIKHDEKSREKVIVHISPTPENHLYKSSQTNTTVYGKVDKPGTKLESEIYQLKMLKMWYLKSDTYWLNLVNNRLKELNAFDDKK